MQIVDLGTGRGSNVLSLAPALTVPQRWLGLDQDASLLREALQRVEALGVPFETAVAQLTPESMDEHLPGKASLITASALIDLVSERWLDALSRAAVKRTAAVLIVLSYSGHFELSPEHPDDQRLRDLVNQHQHGDKGTGSALGPEAPRVLEELLTRAGYRVELAESPWTLSSADGLLARMLLQGWTDAAIEQSPADADRLNRWRELRNRQLSGGNLDIRVWHLDLLALPPGEPA